MNKPTCSIDGCERVAWVKNPATCTMHYMRIRRYGDPHFTKHQKGNPAGTFDARTQREGDCLVWVGAKDSSGYGHFRVRGRLMSVHRYAWESVNGPIPDGMMIDHICHNRACAEVAHLRLSTMSENARNRAGADVDSATGVRNVYMHRGGYRVRIKAAGVAECFGVYSTLDEAAPVAERARRELFGEFAGKG